MELALITYVCFVLFPAITVVTSSIFGVWVAAMVFGLFIGGLNKEYDGSSSVWDYTVTKILCWAKLTVPVFILGLLVPSKEVTAYMVSAYGVQTVAENPKAQELTSDGVDVLQALMKKAKQELEKETK